MPSKLYIFEASPPARAAQMLAKNLGVELEIHDLDFTKQEHLTPEFLKLNPTHTVPVLVEEDGFTLWESHAILIYLVEKYAKNDSLYPKDAKKRAIVNQRLFFEGVGIFGRLISVVRPFYFGKKSEIVQEDLDLLHEGYAFLETFLNETQWIAGATPTIADFSMYATVSSYELLIPRDAQKYPKVSAWATNCETKLPGVDAGLKGLMIYKDIMKQFGILK